MRMVIGSDHGGFTLKEKIKKYLTESGIEVTDVGTDSEDSVDYPDYAEKAVEKILNGSADSGVLVCGSGIGISIAANRFKGIRAALVYNEEVARLSREHNDSNIFVSGGRTMDHDQVLSNLKIWLETKFTGGRHSRRICKLDKY
ncbi:MAG TPA: ribose 5-phosphate isomerase B [Firmicutes bacterium]|nr:ribose 5-phosphate isomerase B [Bacillota bacterium]